MLIIMAVITTVLFVLVYFTFTDSEIDFDAHEEEQLPALNTTPALNASLIDSTVNTSQNSSRTSSGVE